MLARSDYDAEIARSQVRLARPCDEDAVFDAVRLIREDQEFGLRHADGAPLSLCEQKSRRLIRRAVVDEETRRPLEEAWIGILGVPGQLHGCIYLSVDEPIISTDRVLYEIWNFVLPQYRQNNARGARLLINFATNLAHALHLPLVIGVLSHVRTESKRRLYEQALGVKPVGAIFLYNGDRECDLAMGA